MKYPIPACPTCGLALPHTHPVALRFCQERQEQQLFDEAVERARALGRPFQVEEVFKVIWETTGLGIMPQSDSRFVLVREATHTQRRLWGLRPEEEGKDGNS